MGTLGAIGTEPWRQRCQQRDAKGNEGGEEWGGGIPLPSRLGDMGKHQKLPQHGPGQSPGQNGISKIWMPKKPSGSTYFTKFSAIILQLLLEVWAWRAHGKKRLGMLCPHMLTANKTLTTQNYKEKYIVFISQSL